MSDLIWKLEWSPQAEKELKRLNRLIQIRILKFFFNRVLKNKHPRLFGKALKGDLGSYWCYCIGDYRVITNIQDEQLTVVAIKIGHRSDVYDE